MNKGDDLGGNVFPHPYFWETTPKWKKKITNTPLLPRVRLFHCIHHCQDSPSEPDLEVGKIPFRRGEPVQVIQVARKGAMDSSFFCLPNGGLKKKIPFVESKNSHLVYLPIFGRCKSASFVGVHKALRSGDQLVPGDRKAPCSWGGEKPEDDRTSCPKQLEDWRKRSEFCCFYFSFCCLQCVDDLVWW